MELVFPTIEHKNAAWDFKQEHIDCGEMTIHGDGGLDIAAAYEDWLAKIQSDLTRDDGIYVPATVYFGVQDGRIVGVLQIRHKLNDHLMGAGGHIGCGIRPSERGKGYGSRMLALGLEKCRGLGIERALITCNKSNAASARVIEKNGGVQENEFLEDNGTIVRRYWIALC